jgi:putative MATE family efflux protein
MGTQFMQMLYNMTDMFWLGRLSSDAVAASGASGMYMWLGVAPMLVGSIGAEIGVSQNKGRGDLGAAKGFAQNAWMLSLALGVAYGAALVVFSAPLLSFFNIQEPHVASAAASYLSIIGLGIPATYMTASLTGTFNGSGSSRLPFFANAVGLVTNIVMDPVMIFPMGLGIRGAAIATILAQWIVFILLCAAAKKHKDRPFDKLKLLVKPCWPKLGQIVKWSLPVALESGLFTMLTMAVTRLQISFGKDALAVSHVGSQMESLSWLIGGGFGTAVTAFIGQNFGAEKWGRIKRGFRISTAAMLAWGATVTLSLFFGGRAMIGLFLREPELQAMGGVYLKIVAACQLSMNLEAVGAGLFRGSGRTIPPSAVSIALNIARVPLSYLLASTSLGLYGVWGGIAITAGLRGAITYGWAYAALRRKTKALPA